MRMSLSSIPFVSLVSLVQCDSYQETSLDLFFFVVSGKISFDRMFSLLQLLGKVLVP